MHGPFLRKALGEDANGQSYIETVPRVGYRFVGQVTQISSAQSAPTTSGDPAPELEPEKSVAVLYFENLSGDKEDEYFRDGMTEDVITELAKIKDLRLFPRSAVLVFRDKPLPVTEVGQQLRAASSSKGASVEQAAVFASPLGSPKLAPATLCGRSAMTGNSKTSLPSRMKSRRTSHAPCV